MFDDPKEGSEENRKVWENLLELGPRHLASVVYLDPKPWTRGEAPFTLDRAWRCNKVTSTANGPCFMSAQAQRADNEVPRTRLSIMHWFARAHR